MTNDEWCEREVSMIRGCMCGRRRCRRCALPPQSKTLREGGEHWAHVEASSDRVRILVETGWGISTIKQRDECAYLVSPNEKIFTSCARGGGHELIWLRLDKSPHAVASQAQADGGHSHARSEPASAPASDTYPAHCDAGQLALGHGVARERNRTFCGVEFSGWSHAQDGPAPVSISCRFEDGRGESGRPATGYEHCGRHRFGRCAGRRFGKGPVARAVSRACGFFRRRAGRSWGGCRACRASED